MIDPRHNIIFSTNEKHLQHERANAEDPERKHQLDRNWSKQTHRVRNQPNFNTDCISFVSSASRQGFDQLDDNLMTVINKVPKVKV